MRVVKRVLLVLAGIVVVAGIAICVVYGGQLKTLGSLEKLSSYDDGYNLYSIDVDYSYDLDDIVAAGVRDDQSYIDAVLAQVLPGIPVSVKAPKFGCTAFEAQLAGSGDFVMGRNYDFKSDSSALLVRTHPKDGYASIGFAALNNLGANAPEKNITKSAAALLGPFAMLDGVNEKGVSICVLTLDSDPTEQDSGKDAINTSLALRLVLDRAATTQEAVDLLASYDMHAMAGRDYHFFITDAEGDSRVVEYDPEADGRPLVATPVREIANYYAIYADKVQPNQKNGVYGHGMERAQAVASVLDAAGASVTEDIAWAALRASAQDPNPTDVTSNTQWSCVYDNTARSVQITLRRNWGDVFTFEL